MKRLAMGVAAVAMLLVTAACGDKFSTAERLTLANNTITTTARVTETALVQGRIGTLEACTVEVYSRLARAAVDAGFTAYVEGDADGAAGHLSAAQSILSGVSIEAAAQVERECN